MLTNPQNVDSVGDDTYFRLERVLNLKERAAMFYESVRIANLSHLSSCHAAVCRGLLSSAKSRSCRSLAPLGRSSLLDPMEMIIKSISPSSKTLSLPPSFLPSDGGGGVSLRSSRSMPHPIPTSIFHIICLPKPLFSGLGRFFSINGGREGGEG